MDNYEQFRQRLEECLPSLTRSHQRIARFLLEHFDEAAFFSGAQLARELEVSEATIARFAASTGYADFPELRRTLQQIFRNRVSPSTRLKHKLADLSHGDAHIMVQLVEVEQHYLADMLHDLDLAAFDRAVEILLGARRVFVLAGGPSAVLAELFELRMRRFGVSTVLMTESGPDLADKLHLICAEDAVLMTGLNRVRPELRASVEYSHHVGARSILLTDTLGPMFRDKVDVVLAARRGPVSMFHSLTVPMTILNGLVLAFAMARPEASLGALDRMYALRTAYGLDYEPR